MLIKKSLLILSAALLAACSSVPKKTDWPEGMPSYAYFKNYYQKDPAHMQVSTEQQYIQWIKNFYLGSIYYRKGWFDVTKKVISTLPDKQDKELANEKLYLIGKKASSEWAKDNKYRLINLGNVIVWGNAINESMVRKQQLSTLDLILRDIDALLDKKIQSSDIVSSRYFEENNDAEEELFK